jgi:hypothetical protein
MADLTADQTLMNEVIAWAGDSPDPWGALLETVKDRYASVRPFTLEKLTPRELLLCWVGNRYSYARGLQNNSSPDISFYRRIVTQLERSVPQALAVDHGMAKTFTLKIRKSHAGKEERYGPEPHGLAGLAEYVQ